MNTKEEQILSKVPEVTLVFWLIKIAAYFWTRISRTTLFWSAFYINATIGRSAG